MLAFGRPGSRAVQDDPSRARERQARLEAARDFPENLLPNLGPSGTLSAAYLRQIPWRGEAVVTVYRRVPKGVVDIRPGDWVALTRSYATGHARDGAVLSKRVPAGEVYWAGTDLNEWFWTPIRARGSTDKTAEVQRERLRRSTSLTVRELRAALRAAGLPVGGDRLRLVGAYERLTEARRIDPATIGGWTVPELRAALRDLKLRRSGIKIDLVRRLRRVIESSEVGVGPKKKPITQGRSIVWTNVFTGVTEAIAWASSDAEAIQLVRSFGARYDAAFRQVRLHLSDLMEPNVRVGTGTPPEAGEMDLERFHTLARLEASAMGPALSGDRGKLSAIRTQMASVLDAAVKR